MPKIKFAEQEDYFKEKIKDMRSAMENASGLRRLLPEATRGV